jgi:hypothetical protein
MSMISASPLLDYEKLSEQVSGFKSGNNERVERTKRSTLT